MSIVAANERDSLELAPVPVRRFSVDEYHRLIDIGILGPEDRTELVEGWIVPKMTRNPPHDAAIRKAINAISKRLPAGWDWISQSAITLGASEPEPDVTIVRGSDASAAYRDRHPGPADIGMVVEVADSSLSYDRQIKARVYAGAGIAVYWIVNLIDDRIEVFTLPVPSGNSQTYTQRIDYAAPQDIPLIIDGHTVASIPVNGLLP